jgi:hypothetical protein
MNKVYKHRPRARDELLGRVGANGRVYESRLSPDKYVGRVELESGKIFESRFGPDKHIGRVDISSGKVYLKKLGPDEYLGRVEKDGKLYLHRSLARDEYLGRVTDMVSVAHGGGAFLLLLIPEIDREMQLAEEDEAKKEEQSQAGLGNKKPAKGGAEQAG